MQSRRTDIVRLLLIKGADRTLKNRVKKTFRHFWDLINRLSWRFFVLRGLILKFLGLKMWLFIFVHVETHLNCDHEMLFIYKEVIIRSIYKALSLFTFRMPCINILFPICFLRMD